MNDAQVQRSCVCCVCPPQVHNEGGRKRVVVTKNLPGQRWLDILTAADCRWVGCVCVGGGVKEVKGLRECKGGGGEVGERGG
jgi:hypothetical protein